jgi:anti-sigma factor RsiW
MVSEQDFEKLSAYLDGELPQAEKRQLEARLQADPLLQQELDSLTALVAALRDTPTVQRPREYTLTPAMVKPHPPRIISLLNSAWLTPLTAAAAVLLIIVGGALLLIAPPSTQTLTTQQQAPVAIQPTAEVASGMAFDSADEAAPAQPEAAARLESAPPAAAANEPEMEMGIIDGESAETEATIMEVAPADDLSRQQTPTSSNNFAGDALGPNAGNTRSLTITPISTQTAPPPTSEPPPSPNLTNDDPARDVWGGVFIGMGSMLLFIALIAFIQRRRYLGGT